jgi:hypothetical protein
VHLNAEKEVVEKCLTVKIRQLQRQKNGAYVNDDIRALKDHYVDERGNVSERLSLLPKFDRKTTCDRVIPGREDPANPM